MQDKYEQLLERSVIAQEKSANVEDGIREAVKQLTENTKQLNDSFVLHCSKQDEIGKGIKEIKDDLLKWLKWGVVFLITLLSTLAGIEKLPDLIG